MGNVLDAQQWAACPAGTRAIATTYAIVSLGLPALATTAPRAKLHFLCCLWTVRTRRYFWAILASSFYRPLEGALDSLMAVSELSMVAAHLPSQERRLGSIRMLLWTLMATGGTNIVFLAFMEIMRRTSKRNGRQLRLACNQGLWSLILTNVTLNSLTHPDLPADVLGLVTVKRRWYPLSLAVGLSLFNGSVQWESFAAIAFGYFYAHLRMERLLLGLKLDSADRRLEPLLRRLLGGDWLPLPQDFSHSVFGVAGYVAQAVRNISGGSAGTAHRRQAGEQNFQLFRGQGRRLGN